LNSRRHAGGCTGFSFTRSISDDTARKATSVAARSDFSNSTFDKLLYLLEIFRAKPGIRIARIHMSCNITQVTQSENPTTLFLLGTDLIAGGCCWRKRQANT
jgi:hypothetical protein